MRNKIESSSPEGYCDINSKDGEYSRKLNEWKHQIDPFNILRNWKKNCVVSYLSCFFLICIHSIWAYKKQFGIKSKENKTRQEEYEMSQFHVTHSLWNLSRFDSIFVSSINWIMLSIAKDVVFVIYLRDWFKFSMKTQYKKRREKKQQRTHIRCFCRLKYTTCVWNKHPSCIASYFRLL